MGDVDFLEGTFPRGNKITEIQGAKFGSDGFPTIGFPATGNTFGGGSFGDPIYDSLEGSFQPYKIPDIDRPYSRHAQQHTSQNTSQNTSQHTILPLTFTCVDVADHIVSCPVCSKLHKSNASIIIVILCIVILFLGRRFYE